MNTFIRKISPLAIVLLALAAALALVPSANAQSTSLVQIEYSGDSSSDTGKMITASGSTAVLRADNNANFAQHFDRETVSPGVFRFARQGFNACLRVPSTLGTSSAGSVQIGSCSGTRAEWRRVAASGVGDMFVNVATNHVLSPPLCFGGSCDAAVGLFPRSATGGAEGLFRWTFDFL